VSREFESRFAVVRLHASRIATRSVEHTTWLTIALTRWLDGLRSPSAADNDRRSDHENRTFATTSAPKFIDILMMRTTRVEDDRCKFFARRVDLFFTTQDVAVTLFLCVRYFQKEE